MRPVPSSLSAEDWVRVGLGEVGALGHSFSSHKRMAQWVSSRLALSEMLRTNSIHLDSQWSISMSHTQTDALVCGVMAKSSEGSSVRVGVDLESSHRKMSERAIHRVFSQEELRLGLSPIALWTLKEAAFKAFALKGLVLPQIRIQSWDAAQSLALVHACESQRICRVWFFTSKEVSLSFALWTESFPDSK